MAAGSRISSIFLNPGEHFVGDAGHRLRTLLGSCVSVTLWHPRRRIGAMSHFLLPSRGSDRVEEMDGRYGDEAIWLLLRDMTQAEVPLEECEAKIFGGGNMFPDRNVAGRNVGRKNGETAHRLLRHYRIPVVSGCLYGNCHRQIVFDIASGDVWVRKITSSMDGGLANPAPREAACKNHTDPLECRMSANVPCSCAA